ncbi:hypothetical protein LUZ61_007327 [Rhynchospora tenuis]|uniref:Uncharacterized protein n=1 Tax=Rhynchospora tenuis TaxID=198213 RepID=A0AAD5ZT56_9POAL|nr:hypothetical protein LUZ61_007327 [Rhynchospora tenuis]
MGDLHGTGSIFQLDTDPARKAKVDAEVWLAELSELSSSDKCRREKIDAQLNGLYFLDVGDLASKTSSDSFISNELSTDTSPDNTTASILPIVSPSNNVNSPLKRSDATTTMHLKGTQSDTYRVSISSSAPSTSSHGSTHDDFDMFGEILVWGEITLNNSVKTESSKGVADILVPKPLESNISLDVNYVSCGARHAALLTRNGEIFTWGEECKGRLGHGGTVTDSTQPRVVESLMGPGLNPLEVVTCGEFHTCAVTTYGELYTWGDGTHGALGHGSQVSHWIPKRVSGPLDGLNIRYVSCGTWHTALVTSTGRLFTFGDGTFGVLGHGNRDSLFIPKEVESLSGLRTVAVACGVWHMAAAVQVSTSQLPEGGDSGKLFTWGDGDKYRLGHGDKDPRLKPTCVPSLIEHNFVRVSCGHSVTVGLTSSGELFTMGSTVYGQLGNPQSDGRYPCVVGDALIGESIKEVTCGSYHLAVLTSRSEVFTWGKGANGRLGHGDVEDRKVPTLVEGLRDKTIRTVACGASFTVAICQNKRVQGAEQTQCTMCRQPFGFTRKKHMCHNCKLPHCNNCSSRKSFRATHAPNPSKPYRVCDPCYVKLNSDRGLNPSNNFEMVKTKMDSFPLVQIRDVALNGGVDSKWGNKRAGTFGLRVNGSRPVSPFSRRPSPPRSLSPGPMARGFSFPKGSTDGLRRANELLNEEVQRLRAQVDNLKRRCESQELELRKLTKQADDATALAEEESAKSKAAKEVIKTLTSQLKEMAERLPQGIYEKAESKPTPMLNSTNGAHQLRNSTSNQDNSPKETSKEGCDKGGDDMTTDDAKKLSELGKNGDNGSRAQSLLASSNQEEKEWIEQYETGVYITLVAFRDGTRDLKRVRFSRRRFGENQAELWWSENRQKVYEKYDVRGGSDRVSSASSVRSSHLRSEHNSFPPKV